MQVMDDIDFRILRTLQSKGNLNAADVSKHVGLSQSPVWRRIARMEEDGIIKDRPVILDPKKLGFETVVFVRIKLSAHGRQSIEEFAIKAAKVPEIQVVQLLMGEIDFRLRVIVRDLDHFYELMNRELVTLPGVQEIQSSVLLHEYKNTRALPV
ncbi:Lrp/AsnC family transcriptional regulator [Cognatishimia activa]|uniref:Leucine-responsive regulatory protein n=4 Tax=Rhodobacterales TaxID=204455 RepID=A0A0N7MBE7_9RHOB|nr:Lrp/AsnC family transcriptional regulator [Cognatishimia activa]CUH58741.1 Leucine-responsive regulatory protein [Thalassobacter stenotrophicus]CUI94156.1 Leucine-responsive regulatory protein [Cognatishimia activa]CUK25200.1 Leucine-responsive regulatory protein [Cognatishimia activa]SHJ40039.1 transcriptional regulator, AsnC family [Thalassobacter stenotrophicus DSM 16310]